MVVVQSDPALTERLREDRRLRPVGVREPGTDWWCWAGRAQGRNPQLPQTLPGLTANKRVRLSPDHGWILDSLPTNPYLASIVEPQKTIIPQQHPNRAILVLFGQLQSVFFISLAPSHLSLPLRVDEVGGGGRDEDSLEDLGVDGLEEDGVGQDGLQEAGVQAGVEDLLSSAY